MKAESQGSDRFDRSASLISNGVAWRVASPVQVEERTMQLEVVKDYYGKLLKSSNDLKISACCDGAELPPHLQPLLANVPSRGRRQILWLRHRRAGRAQRPPRARSRLGLWPRHLHSGAARRT